MTTLASAGPSSRLRPGPDLTRWLPLAIGLLAAVAVGHAAAVAPHYHVGSFDDDGHYLALAKALLHGNGYVDTSAPGHPTDTLIPPGYPSLLAPLLWLSGGSFWLPRALSAAAYAGCLLLADRLLADRGAGPRLRLATAGLIALNPVGATFATMVMPETVFLLVLTGVLVALPRWQAHRRTFSGAGAVVAVGTPFLLALKTAAVPMVVAVLAWLALRRRWRPLALTVGVSVVMLTPVAVLRLASHSSLVGDRYAADYAGVGNLLTAVPDAVAHYLTVAIPASVVPTFAPPVAGHGPVLAVVLDAVRLTVTPLVVLGWVAWLRRRLDVTVLLVPLYLAETLPYPYINERRVVLLLPLVLAWYALGWRTAGRLAARIPRGWAGRLGRPVAAVLPAVALTALLAPQFPRDYLFAPGQDSSAPLGSGYLAAAQAATPPGWSIATSYRWTVAYGTGRTATNTAHLTLTCPAGGPTPAYAAQLHALLRRQHVAAVIVAALNRPDAVDAPCVQSVLSSAPWAVTTFRGSDSSTVFALVGPGTPRPVTMGGEGERP